MTLTVTTAGDTAVPTIPGTKEFVQWYTKGSHFHGTTEFSIIIGRI